MRMWRAAWEMPAEVIRMGRMRLISSAARIEEPKTKRPTNLETVLAAISSTPAASRTASSRAMPLWSRPSGPGRSDR